MDLKNLADKLADLEKLEKSLTQTSNKVPGEQPTMDPKADVQAMKQALNVIRSPITPTAPTPTQASQQSNNTDQSANLPPEKQDLQQKNKPGEPVGEEMIEEETAKEKYIRQAKERVAKDPSYIYQVDPRVRADVEASMTPRQRNTARIQKNLAQAYADNDEQAIAKWTAELEKRKSADNKPADKKDDKTTATTTDKPATTTTDKPATTTTDKPEDKKGKSKMDTTGPWYRGTEGDYVIKPGDTLYKIAKQTGIPMSQLQKMNNIQNVNKIVAGAKLKTTTSPQPQQSEKPAPTNNNNNFVYDPNTGEMVPSDSSQAQEIKNLTIGDNPTDGPPVTTVDPSAEVQAQRQQQKDAEDNKTNQNGASTPKPSIGQGAKDAQAVSNATPPSPPKPGVAQGVKDAQAASTAKAPKVKSIDTLRHTADSSDQDAAQAARDEIKHRMQAGTLKENLISLNNVVEELLEK